MWPPSPGGYSTHELGIQETVQTRPTVAELVQTRYQCKRQVWPHLDQHTYPPATGRVAVRRLVAFPVTVTADKKPTDIVKKSPGGFSPGPVIPDRTGTTQSIESKLRFDQRVERHGTRAGRFISPRRGRLHDRRGQTATLVNRPRSGAGSDK